MVDLATLSTKPAILRLREGEEPIEEGERGRGERTGNRGRGGEAARGGEGERRRGRGGKETEDSFRL